LSGLLTLPWLEMAIIKPQLGKQERPKETLAISKTPHYLKRGVEDAKKILFKILFHYFF